MTSDDKPNVNKNMYIAKIKIVRLSKHKRNGAKHVCFLKNK